MTRRQRSPVPLELAIAPGAGLWTQREAARYLNVSARYLRESGCPKVLLPGNGPKGQPLVRYRPADVEAWLQAWHTSRANLRSA